MADEGFEYEQGNSTTNLFYYNNMNAHLKFFTWRRPAIGNPILPANVNPQPTIYSSCQGLIACRCNPTSKYYVGNPFIDDNNNNIVRYDMLPNPPRFHFPFNTQVVLAVEPSRAFLLICARCVIDNIYIFDIFNSQTENWRSLRTMLDRHEGFIVPNSGVSCGRIVYWLLSDPTQTLTAVLSFETGDDNFPDKGLILKLPQGVPGEARMQLGRAMGGLGLVIVNEASSTVELCILNAQAVNWENLWPRFELFNVELQVDDAAENGDGWIPTWRQEDKTIVCREMPRPIRFDSFKVELLFWLQGRVLRLENSSIDPHNYRMTVLPQDLPVSITIADNPHNFRMTVFPEVLPASITDGLPHVRTDFLCFVGGRLGSGKQRLRWWIPASRGRVRGSQGC